MPYETIPPFIAGDRVELPDGKLGTILQVGGTILVLQDGEMEPQIYFRDDLRKVS